MDSSANSHTLQYLLPTSLQVSCSHTLVCIMWGSGRGLCPLGRICHQYPQPKMDKDLKYLTLRQFGKSSKSDGQTFNYCNKQCQVYNKINSSILPEALQMTGNSVFCTRLILTGKDMFSFTKSRKLSICILLQLRYI